MKRILTLLFLFISIGASAQWSNVGTATLQRAVTLPDTPYRYNMGPLGFYYLAQASKITGGTISTLPFLGQVLPHNIPVDSAFKLLYFGSQPPTATLTGGTVYELTVSNKTHSLAYNYGRQSATATIATVVINPGSFNVFTSQPAQPGTVSGTQSVTTTANTNTTYTETVTTTDSKTATSSTSDTFLPRFFYFRSPDAVPTQADILAFAGGSNPLQAGHNITAAVIIASGSNYPAFAYLASEGNVTVILDVNGFNVTSAFNATTISLTNSQGYTASYRVYTLNAATSSNYTITTN